MSLPFDKHHLPVFPLHTVVFVNGILQLQIFEQRYLTLIKTCMQHQHGFVTALIRSGKEVEDTPEIYSIGTYVEIIDWDSLDNNLLGISIQGQQRVRINKTHIRDNNLMSAEIDYLDNLKIQDSDIIDDDLLALLNTLKKHPFVVSKYPDINNDSVLDSAYKLCELLPVSSSSKQKLLEADQFRSLLDLIKDLVAQLEG